MRYFGPFPSEGIASDQRRARRAGRLHPGRPGWEDRSRFISQEGLVTFLHFDLVAQALAKIERGHSQDREDVQEMIRRGLVDPATLREAFAAIEPELYRYPAIDPPSFRRAVDEMALPADGN